MSWSLPLNPVSSRDNTNACTSLLFENYTYCPYFHYSLVTPDMSVPHYLTANLLWGKYIVSMKSNYPVTFYFSRTVPLVDSPESRGPESRLSNVLSWLWNVWCSNLPWRNKEMIGHQELFFSSYLTYIPTYSAFVLSSVVWLILSSSTHSLLYTCRCLEVLQKI